MSQQMHLMYTETPCFGENKWTQKITQNTRKYILQRAAKVTDAKFRGWRQKNFGKSHEKSNAHFLLFFARNAPCMTVWTHRKII